MKKIALALLLLATPALAAVPAPRPSISSLAQLPIVTMDVYDEKADADAAVARAFARAKTSGKRVLLDLGGDWCPDCIVLANFMKLPEIKRFVDRHYEVVEVDVGRFNRNLHIPAKLGFTEKLRGAPAVLVFTPDRKLVNRGDVFTTANARGMTPQGLADYLARYAK
jgi:thiol-disulfide isomerase/thioredoxin